MAVVKNPKQSRNRGTLVVEAALVLPILLLLTLGVIQYSWLFLKAQQITNAARSGARVAIVDGDVQLAVTNALKKTGMTVGTPDITSSTVDGREVLTVKLTSTSSVRLLDISFLPTPETLHASVTMAKEGPG